MRRFFFYLYDDLAVIDEEGMELPDEAAAREQAASSARQMACAEVLDGHLDLSHRIEVVDEAGQLVATIHFRDVIRLAG